jgi:hypothetical protein
MASVAIQRVEDIFIQVRGRLLRYAVPSRKGGCVSTVVGPLRDDLVGAGTGIYLAAVQATLASMLASHGAGAL